MIRVHHINCGTLLVTGYPTVVCHCLLLEHAGGLTLVDSGIGLADVRDPAGRLGQPLIDLAGFQFHEVDTAVRRIADLGLNPGNVNHIVLTHGDPDHAGGLADFPQAQVHVSTEELAQIQSGHWRYVPKQLEHQPHWNSLGPSSGRCFGFEARTVWTEGDSEVLLIPLPGHTLGHCGVAIRQGDRWMLHAGDAYYLRAELTTDDHPVSVLAAQRADNDELRRRSLAQLRRLARDHAEAIEIMGYHDLGELPGPQRIGPAR